MTGKKLTWLLTLFTLAMFGFGYALVPFYNMVCDALGINGRTENIATASPTGTIDTTRTLTVEFVATNNKQLPWAFYPLEPSVTLHPGEQKRIAYYAKNNSTNTMTVQAIPSIAPGVAAKYLRKTECFCFEQQTLAPGESLEMPLLFHLDRDIPSSIPRVTLSYTLFDVTGTQRAVAEERRGKLMP